MLEDVSMETVAAIPYDVLKEGLLSWVINYIKRY